jgi:hypothetical protein
MFFWRVHEHTAMGNIHRADAPACRCQNRRHDAISLRRRAPALSIQGIPAEPVPALSARRNLPLISVQEGTDLELATELHQKVHAFCFIARSVNFPVSYEPTFNVVAR